ncbi:MAG: hypothetical protein ACE5KZ_10680 [Candidatus Scalinduaceae bacterium]
MVKIKRFVNGLKHAFAIDVAKLENDDIVLIKRLADYVVRRKMSVPAIMFLESVRPLNFIGSQVMLFFKPILTHFFSKDEYNRISDILEKREVIDILISEIEQKDTAKH